MTIKEIKNRLKELGFTALCNDNKTLTAYNQIQGFLKANKTPMKAIDSLYLDNGELRAVVNGYDLEMGYSIDFEKWLNN